MESFNEAPKSFTERQAERDGSCRPMTPRDTLVMLLREIDNGQFSPDKLVVVYAYDASGGVINGSHQSGISMMETIGLLEMAKQDLLLNSVKA